VQAEADLDAVYEELKADARQRLGRLYNTADYPAEIRGLFRVGWDFPSVKMLGYLVSRPSLWCLFHQRLSHKSSQSHG
jgi:hypothetical protein